jgi:hypothetical protein
VKAHVSLFVGLLLAAGLAAGCGAAPPSRDAASTNPTETTPPSEPDEPPVTSVMAKSGATSARLSYSIPHGAAYFHATLTIDRSGEREFAGTVEPYSEQLEFSGTKPVAVHGGKPLTVTDLDGDGEPEVLVDLYWGGVHCCWSSRIYRWHPTKAAYISSAQLWGNFAYRLVDLDQDRQLEFVSADNRFAYEFTSFAGSSFPLQIWTYRGGRLLDTTRDYPALVADDARQEWRRYRDELGRSAEDRVTRGFLAAWAADECLLDRCDQAFATLYEVREDFAHEDFGSAAEYLKHLHGFLDRTGYLRPAPAVSD